MWPLVIACSPVPSDSPQASDTSTTAHPDSAADSTAADTAIESIGGEGTGPHPFFREDVVHEAALTLPAESWASLESDGSTYVSATLEDGSSAMEVGVRIKGWTSAQPLTGKPSLKIDIDRIVPGQRYHDLEAFDLHAELTDAAALSEWAAYRMFRDQGLPASRTGWAHLTLNGMDYGFYTAVEKKDDQLIEVWWSDTTGSLYESSSESWPCDLDDPGCGCFEADEIGTGDTRADLEALCLAATDTSDSLWLETVSALVPWEAFTRFMATEILIGAHDHYAGFSGNFYLYHEPSAGGWSFIPSSMNNQFGSSSSTAPTCTATDYAIADYQHGILAQRCQADTACMETLLQALGEAAVALRDGSLVDDISTVQALIAPYVEADPRSPWTIEQFEGQVECIQDWLLARPEALGVELPEDCLGEGEDLNVTSTGTLSTNQRCDRDTPEAPVYAVESIDKTTVELDEDAVGILAGDEVLLMIMQGSVDEVGRFALRTVDSVSGQRVALTEAAELMTEGQHLTLQRVPSFRDVTVGPEGILTTSAWDGQTGGVLAFRATGTLQIAAGGRLTMSGRGYRGGETGPSSNTDGHQGESLSGTGSGGGSPGEGYNEAGGWWVANLGGGGALISGGGGEHAGGATAGESWNGEAPAPEPGEVQGDAELLQPLMGSGGGGVALIYDSYGPGGAGGGVVLLWADTVVVEGSGGLTAQGETTTSWTRGTWTYGAGGGAGGSIWILADHLELPDEALIATGGAGYTDVDRPGGQGGGGRIRVDCQTINSAACAEADWANLAQPPVGWVGP